MSVGGAEEREKKESNVGRLKVASSWCLLSNCSTIYSVVFRERRIDSHLLVSWSCQAWSTVTWLSFHVEDLFLIPLLRETGIFLFTYNSVRASIYVLSYARIAYVRTYVICVIRTCTGWMSSFIIIIERRKNGKWMPRNRSITTFFALLCLLKKEDYLHTVHTHTHTLYIYTVHTFFQSRGWRVFFSAQTDSLANYHHHRWHPMRKYKQEDRDSATTCDATRWYLCMLSM